jgi:hypothetical protein
MTIVYFMFNRLICEGFTHFFIHDLQLDGMGVGGDVSMMIGD